MHFLLSYGDFFRIFAAAEDLIEHICLHRGISEEDGMPAALVAAYRNRLDTWTVGAGAGSILLIDTPDASVWRVVAIPRSTSIRRLEFTIACSRLADDALAAAIVPRLPEGAPVASTAPCPLDGDARPGDFTPGVAEAALSVIEELLDCRELNLAEMEPPTQAAVARARDLLEHGPPD